MAVVYRATDTRSGKDVALKAPRARAGADTAAERLRRLLREVRTSARLAHPHIVRMLGAFDHGGRPWIVLEHVDGEPLSAALDRGAVFAPRDVAACGEALASALSHAHGRGVLHGDVAPANVLLGRDGKARLSDFGLAQLAEGPDAAREGRPPRSAPGGAPRRIAGTLPYIAPEILEGRAPGPRSDLFSLGAVLYEMAAGAPPFKGTGDEGLCDAILRDEPPPFATSGRAVPESLERVVRRALAKDPTARYASAEEMEADLRALRAGMDA